MDGLRLNPSDMMVAECRVITVDPVKRTMDIVSDGPNTVRMSEIPWPAPWRNYNGGGIDFVPEVGATCWTLWHPWDDFPIVLGWSSQYHGEAGFGSTSYELNPGDIILWSKDTNRIVVRRGGNIEIIAGEACKRYFIATDNLIKDVAQNYVLEADGGVLSWVSGDFNASGVEDPTKVAGDSSVFSLEMKRFSTDGEPLVRLRGGNLQDSPLVGTDPVVFELEVVDRFRLAISSEGGAKLQLNESLTVEISNALTITTVNDITLTSQLGKLLLESQAKGIELSCKLGSYAVQALDSTETITGQKHLAAAAVRLGKNPTEPAVLGVQLLTWLASHTHLPPAGPPATLGTLPLILSKTVSL